MDTRIQSVARPTNNNKLKLAAMEKNTFKVFKTNRLSVDANPVVVTAVALDGKKVISEYHIFMQDAQAKSFSQRTEADALVLPDIKLTIDCDFMLHDAAICAENRLNYELSEWYLRTKEPICTMFGYKLEETDNGALIRIQLTGKYRNKLEAIRQASVSKDLTDFLKSIRNLPVFYRQEDFVS